MFKKISFVTAGNMINALLGFIFLWAVANSLSLEDFGKYALFVSILLVLARLTDFGTNSIFVTKSIINKVNTESFIGLKIILFFAAAIIGLVVLALFDLFSLELCLILVGSLMAYTINYLLYAFYQKEQKFTFLVLLYTIPALVKALFAPLLILKVLTPSLALTTGIFGLSIFAGLILIAFDNPLKKISVEFNTNLLKSAWPAGISQLLTEIWPTLSNAIAKTIEGFSDVGVFSLANKVSVIFSLISLSIFSVLLPKNAQRKKQDLKYSFDEIFILTGAILVLGVFGVIASRFIIVRLFGPQFERSLGLLNILVFAAAFNAIAAFMENYFFIQENTRKILTISLAKLGIFFAVATLLIPSAGLAGIAYAQLLSAITAALITGFFIFLPSDRKLL